MNVSGSILNVIIHKSDNEFIYIRKMTHEKAEITVILKYFSDLLRKTSKDDERTRNFNVARFFVG